MVWDGGFFCSGGAISLLWVFFFFPSSASFVVLEDIRLLNGQSFNLEKKQKTKMAKVNISENWAFTQKLS